MQIAIMENFNVVTRIPQPPLADGQVWRMAELNLQVGMVGKLLVHYKLAKPNAVRIPNLVGSISTVEKYLKKNKAVLEAPAVPATNGCEIFAGQGSRPTNGKSRRSAKKRNNLVECQPPTGPHRTYARPDPPLGEREDCLGIFLHIFDFLYLNPMPTAAQ